MMAWKYVLLVIGISVAAIAYLLYTPLPDGYSSACTRHIQMTLVFTKLINVLVSVLSFLASVSMANINSEH